ncbi:thioesterase II family protein [Paludifilum halophilum]|nr:thioesterase [Paludifilum halophilum]
MMQVKLLCFPYAGGSARIYDSWKNNIHPSIDVVPIEPSGRGTRMNEPLCDSMEEMVEDLYPRVRKELEDHLPYALFGHSLGGLVVYEMAHRLMEKGDKKPQHLFVSGKRAPHMKDSQKQIHRLRDQEFIQEIYQLGGTPKEVLQEKELLELILPVLRKDYRVAETYRYPTGRRLLTSEISVLYGTRDEIMSGSEAREWEELTAKGTRTYPFEGGHFFIHDHWKEVLKTIQQTLLGSPVSPSAHSRI